MGWGYSSVAEHLTSMSKNLGSVPSTTSNTSHKLTPPCFLDFMGTRKSECSYEKS